MALIKCSECGREISDKAVSCPGCGCPVNQDSNDSDIITCSKCKFSIPADSKYCPNCKKLITVDDFNYSGKDFYLQPSKSPLFKNVKVPKERGVPECPKCHSTSITYADKKLSIGRAVVGGAIIGAPGAILGGLSSKKGYAVCLNCGKRWKL